MKKLGWIQKREQKKKRILQKEIQFKYLEKVTWKQTIANVIALTWRSIVKKKKNSEAGYIIKSIININ